MGLTGSRKSGRTGDKKGEGGRFNRNNLKGAGAKLKELEYKRSSPGLHS